MLRLFRTIRSQLLAKNKLKKYLLYAVGEIALVMIGILLALQVNNWNEHRKESIRERALLHNVLEDLKADSVSFARNAQTLADIQKLHKQLYEVGLNKRSIDEIEDIQYIRLIMVYNPITKENDPFLANKISNETVREEVLNYYRIMNNVDNSNEEFVEVVKNRIRVYLGQNKIHNLAGRFENPKQPTITLHRSEFAEIVKQPAFKQLLFEANVKLHEAKDALLELINQNNRLKAEIQR